MRCLPANPSPQCILLWLHAPSTCVSNVHSQVQSDLLPFQQTAALDFETCPHTLATRNHVYLQELPTTGSGISARPVAPR